MKKLKRLAACLLIALLLAGTFSVTSTEAALSKPANCRFHSWRLNPSTEKLDFTACRVAWNYVSGADYYEIIWNRTDGGGKTYRRYQYAKYNVLDITGLSSNHVYKFRVRAIKYNSSKTKISGYSGWSNLAFITPLPRTATFSLKGSSKVKASWNRIYSATGYNVFMATSPTGRYYKVNTTAAKSTATSATITKFRGSNLKRYQNYYVRIVPRLKSGGKWQTVASPSNYYQGGFYIRVVYR